MIENHKLAGIPFKQTPNVWALPLIAPENIIIHYSMSGTVAGTVAHLTNPKSQVSAHIVIGRDGEEVWQLARFNQRAWHCGASEWKGKKSRNYYDIGIEFVNWGPIELDKDGKTFHSKWGQVVPAEEVEEATHKNETAPRYWHKFTPEQLAKGAEIAREILTTYPTIEDVIGHDDIAPGRKSDPGPLFPMEDFRRACFGAPEITPIGTSWNHADVLQFDHVTGSEIVVISFTMPNGEEGVDTLSMSDAYDLYEWFKGIVETCTCHEMYTSRGMKDPDCRKHG